MFGPTSQTSTAPVDLIVDGNVPRNIAEGAGRWSKLDMSKHYKIARGEAMKCAASLDVFNVRRLIEPRRHEHGIELLLAIVAMLTKMITVHSST